MVAATKKGRPKKQEYAEYEHLIISYSEIETSKRALQNRLNATRFLMLLDDIEDVPHNLFSFFYDSNGNNKHQGIAEQLGRKLNANVITEQEAINLATHCIDKYEQGISCKELEKYLRAYNS